MKPGSSGGVHMLKGFFLFPTLGMFFFSAWLVMIFVGVLAEDTGIRPFGYSTAVAATAALWLALLPLLVMRRRMRFMGGRWHGPMRWQRPWQSQAEM
jgi:hypothetical protein